MNNFSTFSGNHWPCVFSFPPKWFRHRGILVSNAGEDRNGHFKKRQPPCKKRTKQIIQKARKKKNTTRLEVSKQTGKEKETIRLQDTKRKHSKS